MNTEETKENLQVIEDINPEDLNEETTLKEPLTPLKITQSVSDPIIPTHPKHFTKSYKFVTLEEILALQESLISHVTSTIGISKALATALLINY